LPWLVLLFAAAWVRLSRAAEVFVAGEVIPVGADSYYHLRRILLTAESFPHTSVFDPFMSWPDGAQVPWAAGFDQLGALVVLLGGGADGVGVPMVAFLPVAIGLLTVAATVAATCVALPADPRKLWIGYAAGWVVALLPQSVAVSQLGRLDHHVAEVLLMALLALWAARALTLMPHLRDGLRFEARGVAIALAAMHVFNGSVVYLSIATLMLLAMVLFRPQQQIRLDRCLVGTGAPAMALAAGALAVVVRPAVASHGHALSFMYSSYLQPSLVALAGLVIAAVAVAARVSPHEVVTDGGWVTARTAARRAAVALGLLAPVGLVVLLAAPSAWEQIGSGLSLWLAKDDAWMAAIDETQPLLSGPPWVAASWARCGSYFGVLGLAAPALIPLGLWEAWRQDRTRGAWLMSWTLALTLLTLIQSRFGRIATVNLAICTALGLSALVRLGDRKAARLGDWQRGVAVIAATMAIAVGDPTMKNAFAPNPKPLTAAAEAAIFLRDNTPPVQRGVGSGVLAPWDMAFAVAQLGERPVVVSGFGPYLSRDLFQRVQAVWRGDEPQLLTLMERRDVGYVVAGAGSYLGRFEGPDGRGPFERGRDGRDRLDAKYFESLPLAPLVVAGSGLPAAEVSHLRQLMPIYASVSRVGGLTFPLSRLWIYQRVAGATLEGQAEGVVIARLAMRVHGAVSEHVAWTRADGGHWSLTVALPTGYRSPGIETAARYVIRAGSGAPQRVEVSEQAVRSGARIKLHPMPTDAQRHSP